MKNQGYTNMCGDYIIEYKYLNQDVARKIENNIFTIINLSEDQVNEIVNTGIPKDIRELFPNSIFDYVSGEGLYVIPGLKE
jgi:hypothetical protein